MSKITIKEAFKNLKTFIVGQQRTIPEKDALDKEKFEKFKHTDLSIPECKRCGFPMMNKARAETDFVSVAIYQCVKCGMLLEHQVRRTDNTTLKDIYLYDQFESDTGEFTEILTNMSYNSFTLARLWLVMDKPCYPVLVKSEFTSGITLVFVPCELDITKNDVEGFLYTDHGFIGSIRLYRNQKLSFFANPYLINLPHVDFNYLTYPTERSETLEYISSIRYKLEKDSKHYDFFIIFDNPKMCYGIEIFIRFTRDDPKKIKYFTPLLGDLDFRNIVLKGDEVKVAEGYSIQIHRITKLNPYSISSYPIEIHIRENVVREICHFFEVVDTKTNT